MPEFDECSVVGCCDGLTCVNTILGKQCQNRPACHTEKWRDCSEVPCCDGLQCVPFEGRKVCAAPWKCMPENEDCAFSPCCENGDRPLECVASTDTEGAEVKSCKPKKQTLPDITGPFEITARVRYDRLDGSLSYQRTFDFSNGKASE